MIEFVSEQFSKSPWEFDGVIKIRFVFTLSNVKHFFMSVEPRCVFDGYSVIKPCSLVVNDF